jgi:hypothetical protein
MCLIPIYLVVICEEKNYGGLKFNSLEQFMNYVS